MPLHLNPTLLMASEDFKMGRNPQGKRRSDYLKEKVCLVLICPLTTRNGLRLTAGILLGFIYLFFVLVIVSFISSHWDYAKKPEL